MGAVPTSPIGSLGTQGPGSEADPVSLEVAIDQVTALAQRHAENFSVLSSLVPRELRADLGAVYAFCRWADDLADETGAGEEARARSIELLAWWRRGLERCFAGEAGHPVFVALRETIGRRRLRPEPFHALIDAFEQDQRVTRYRTWDELCGYCRGSANPVGQIVLTVAGYRPPDEDPANEDRYRMSDATCTALQLTNFWQDVRRDLLERDRVYLPSDETGLDAQRLHEWAGGPGDHEARVTFIKALRPLVARTSLLFDQGDPLPSTLSRDVRGMVWLFGAGGRAVLGRIERMGCATLWARPRLARSAKLGLVARAWAGRVRRGRS